MSEVKLTMTHPEVKTLAKVLGRQTIGTLETNEVLPILGVLKSAQRVVKMIEKEEE